MPEPGDLHESVSQFENLGLWLHRQSAGSVSGRAAGSGFVWCHTTWPFGNQAVLTEPVTTRQELDQQAEAVVGFAAGRSEMFLWVLCHHLIPEDLAAGLPETLSRHGLHHALTTMGMVAPDGLTPPPDAGPDCTVRRAVTQEDMLALSRINAAAYMVPMEWAPDLVTKISLVADDCFAYLAEVGGQPVSSAATFVLDGRLYVAFVATLPGYGQQGLAEAVLRASIEAATKATGIRRTVLHATEAGHSLYRRIGFRDVAPCTMFAGSPRPAVP
ncbi:MAG: GNAT family N-acetyltransferase [Bryobacteraceae bacterium]|nr:GNAT family N-acetyltransferase [Bryobacteraceae bacterium]